MAKPKSIWPIIAAKMAGPWPWISSGGGAAFAGQMLGGWDIAEDLEEAIEILITDKDSTTPRPLSSVTGVTDDRKDRDVKIPEALGIINRLHAGTDPRDLTRLLVAAILSCEEEMLTIRQEHLDSVTANRYRLIASVNDDGTSVTLIVEAK